MPFINKLKFTTCVMLKKANENIIFIIWTTKQANMLAACYADALCFVNFFLLMTVKIFNVFVDRWIMNSCQEGVIHDSNSDCKIV
jgi:hypothetical protein